LLVRLSAMESRSDDEDIDRGALRQVLRVRDELISLSPVLGGEGRGEGRTTRERPQPEIRKHMAPLPRPLPGLPGRGSKDELLLRLPLFAYPDRVCRRRGNDPLTAVMVGGGGVRLAAESVVRQHEFFLALDARQDQRNPNREEIVHIASGIDPVWLEE